MKRNKNNENPSNTEIMTMLREAKEKNGRLSKLGEWMLEHFGKTGFYVEQKDMKYVMK